MVDWDAPLDFETEDALALPSPPASKKRKKVIGLDDLLTDYYEERKRFVKIDSKRASGKKHYDSDDDDDDRTQKAKEAELSKFVNDCQEQVHRMITEDDVPPWGQRIFGLQKDKPSFDFPDLERCKFLRSFLNNESDSKLILGGDIGKDFIEGLLVNGWLLKLVVACGHVEESLAFWTFNLMLYSSNEELQASACEFWLAILLSKNEVGHPLVRLDWLPNYSQLKDALKIYGCLLDSSSEVSSLLEVDNCHLGQHSHEGPLPNFTSWLKLLAAFCQIRSINTLFSTSEVEDFLGVIILFSLDRKLVGLSLLFDECLQSVLNFFTHDEWISSCVNVAKSLAGRIPKDLNCLRAVECISGVSTRSKHLRNELAFQVLLNCFDMKVADAEVVMKLVLSINLRDKSCDFFKIYIYLVLAENWLFSNPLLEHTPVILEMWGDFLRNCSCHITSTDWRSYASKVRNKASYLLQNMREVWLMYIYESLL